MFVQAEKSWIMNYMYIYIIGTYEKYCVNWNTRAIDLDC